MTQKITTCSIYDRANDELKYSLLGARRLKPIRAQKGILQGGCKYILLGG